MFMPGFDIESSILVKPEFATRDHTYTCPVCKEFLILRAGSINRPHFAHKSNSNCSYTDHPNESVYHLIAKTLLCQHLNQGGIIHAKLECSNCKVVGYHTISTGAMYDAKTEYRIDNIIADIYLNGIIIEIYHTHRQYDRPEPWYEFRAKDVLESSTIEIKDTRDRLCDACLRENLRKYDCKLTQCQDCGDMFSERQTVNDICISCYVKRKNSCKTRKRKKKYCGYCQKSGVKTRRFSKCRHFACIKCIKTNSCRYCA